MERKRGGLVPIGEAFSGLDRPEKALRKALPQSRHHFTQSEQVHQLVTASEADPDMGFMARLMALCSLPRTNPGNQLQYKRVNGPYTLYMNALAGNKLPFGNLPRLLLAWVSTEAVRTQSRELVLGRSLSEFMRSLGIYTTDGNAHTRLRNQMNRLFACTVSLIYEDKTGFKRVSSLVADKHEFLVGSQTTRRALAVGEQDRAGREILPGDHQPPGASGHEYPKGPQAILAGPGSLPVADLPDLHAPSPAAALLVASVPPVRSEPLQGERPGYSR